MCLIVFAYKMNPEYPLILLANRDEFYDRPTAAAGFWDDQPNVFAGRDLVYGGTWLGITTTGRFAALTNFRQPGGPKGTASRGQLVSNFLTGDSSVFDYLENVKNDSGDYSGFNLLAGTFSDLITELGCYSNRGGNIEKIERGVFGLSNHLLDTGWPKVRLAKSRFERILEDRIDDESLFGVLTDKTPADNDQLPDTGIGTEYEKVLSPIFIETPIYGTRCSSLVKFRQGGELSLKERVF